MSEPTLEGTHITNAEEEATTTGAPSTRYLLRRGAIAGALLGMAPLLLWVLIVLIADLSRSPTIYALIEGTSLGELATILLISLIYTAALGALVALLAVGLLHLWRKYSPHSLAQYSVAASALCTFVAFMVLYGVRALFDVVRYVGWSALVLEPWLVVPIYLGILYATAVGAWFGWRYLSNLKGETYELPGESA